MLKIIDRIKIRYGKQPAHICSPDCLRLFPDDNQSDFWLSKNPYLKPMVKNFARIAVKNPTKRSIEICYISPCGKPLTTIENIQKYLLLTKCMDLTTINFTLSKNFVLQKISIQEKAPTIMDISNGLEPIPISAVNSITNKPFNSSRRYIKNSVYESKTYLNVKHIVDNINQCNDDDCSTLCHSRCKCAGGDTSYRYKRLFHYSSEPIFECTSKCGCSIHCMNKVASLGIQCEFQVFFSGMKGWAVRATHFISKGTYVFSYVGELSQTKYHKEKKLGSDEYTATIGVYEKNEKGILRIHDSTEYSDSDEIDSHVMLLEGLSESNLACYVNHSCNPNLFSQLVVIENGHGQLVPTYGLFAIRDINPFEELCWDYHYSLTESLPMDCHCEATNCHHCVKCLKDKEIFVI
ncbi:histone-lysine N-methyltransferase eggless [Dermatophagoides farinae]